MDKTILLVEDDYALSELYQMILEKHGYQIRTAYDGEQGFELALNSPDLILLDIMLPKMNGLELLNKLKSDDRTKHIPVVLFTNLGDMSVIQQAIEKGIVGYLLKADVDPKDLAEQVSKFLTIKNASR